MSHKYSIETLYHFNCERCNRWWSIADFGFLPPDQEISCPYCEQCSRLEKAKPLEECKVMTNDEAFYKWWDSQNCPHSLSLTTAHFELIMGAWNAAKPQWHDIKSAPKDGTEVILRIGDDVFVGKWIANKNYRGEFGWHDSNYCHELWYSRSPEHPTHWQPLPEPPKDY